MKKIFCLMSVLFVVNALGAVSEGRKYPSQYIDNYTFDETQNAKRTTDTRYTNKQPAGIMTTLTVPTTVYFYGYGTSFMVTIKGSTATFKCSWMDGKLILDGSNAETGIGDNFEVSVSSPTYIYLDFPTGTGIKANVYLRGLK